MVAGDCLGQKVSGVAGQDTFTLTFPEHGVGDQLVSPRFHEPEWLDDDGKSRNLGFSSR